MKELLAIFLITCIMFFACKSQKVNNNLMSVVKVRFAVNDSACSIDSDFEITINKVNDTNVIFRRTLLNDTLPIPDSIWNKADYYKVSVRYKDYSFDFDSVNVNLVKPSDKIEWKFGIEKKPFLIVGSIIHPDLVKNDPNLKAIYFWKFRPYEGHGQQIIKKVY